MPFRAFVAIVATCLLLASAPAGAETSEGPLHFRGTELQPELVTREGRRCYRLSDPAVQRLLSLSVAQFQWSSTGQTLYVYAPGRESFWTPGSDTITVNGEERPAPGLLVGSEEGAAMEPAALRFALGLEAFPGEAGTELLPVLTSVEFQGESSQPVTVLKAAAPVRAEESRPEPGTVELTLEGVAWGDRERTMRKGPIRLVAEGGGGPADPLKLRFEFPTNWDGQTSTGTLLNEIQVGMSPNFPVPERAEAGRLENLDRRSSPREDLLVLELDRPVQFFWDFDRETRRLNVEIPHLTAEDLPSGWNRAGSFLQEGRVETLETGRYPVLRLNARLSRNAGFEFFEAEEKRGSLVLRLAPRRELDELADSGSATTSGYSLARGVIVIDPGHGGSDPGCVNRSLGLQEKHVTLDISMRLKELLEQQGWTVILTRTTDRDVTWAGSPNKTELQARCDVANDIEADLFMSIHCNASYSSVHRGTSIHWYKTEDYEFAQSLEYVLGASLGLGQKGLIRDRFYVLRHTTMPAVLVETAYLTNMTEGAMLGNPNFRQRIAERLAGGLLAFMQSRTARGEFRSGQTSP